MTEDARKIQPLIAKDPIILLDKDRLKNLFNDVFRNDLSKVNLMMMSYDIGIVTEIRKVFPLDKIAKSRLTKLLIQQHSIVEEKAMWAVETWLSCVSIDVIATMKKIEKENDEKEKLAAITSNIPETKKTELLDYALQTRDDYDEYYTNPQFDEIDNRIYIPCGIGNTDRGFFIYGIKKALSCTHKYGNVYALIYNFLVRNSKITIEHFSKYLSDIESNYELNYRNVYRISIVLLQMIKNNYMRETDLDLEFIGDKDSLRYAMGMINHYAALFCRLIKLEPIKMNIRLIRHGHKFSLTEGDGIFVRNNTEITSNAREMWYGRKIKYRLSKDNLRDLEYLLSEISPFDSFREGQYEALCKMLSFSKHAICIMPTGSGKSLIFYMASILQPLPLFIVTPTEILIQDQIRNIKKFHHMDNVAHLRLTVKNNFSEYHICNSLNYLTPMTLQNRNLLVYFRFINNGASIVEKRGEQITAGSLAAYIILDEVHCLSNWGHDFRPEYLMLSKFLNKFLDQVNFWGFTATANYTVVEDIQKQLDIPQENFICPIPFEKINVSYHFVCVKTTKELFEKTVQIVQQLIEKHERTIIFTKNDKLSRKLADLIGDEADFFTHDNVLAYHHFVDNKCKILVANEDLGIGVNFPEISNIIHLGLPLSKNEYVQEIGRAGRAFESVKSYVVYLENNSNNIPPQLLKRNTRIEDITLLLQGVENDYSDIYKKLTNNCPTKDELYLKVVDLYREVVSKKQARIVNSYCYEELENAKQMLFMLYSVGYINDWYTSCTSKNGNGVDISIDICSEDPWSYDTDPNKMLRRMKNRLRDYFDFLGNNRDSIARTDRSNTPEEVIRVFIDWYYIKFLYHHNEQFLDLYEFIQSNADNNSERITASIKDYFTLPFIKLKSDETLFGDMSIKEITNKVIQGVSKPLLVNIERINSNRYSYKFDFLLFCGHLRLNGRFEEGRLERLLTSMPSSEQNDIRSSFIKLYAICDVAGKLSMINYLESPANSVGIEISHFLISVYKDKRKDLMFYGIIANHSNKLFRAYRRPNNV